MNGVGTVIWQSAVGGIVTLIIGAAVTWLAHRQGWLAKPAAAVAGWLRAEGGTISTDVVKLIADELQRRQLAAAEGPKGEPPAGPTGHHLAPLAVPPSIIEGEQVVVRRLDGTEEAYTVEGVQPATVGVTYRLRPSTLNPGVNMGDPGVPGSSRG